MTIETGAPSAGAETSVESTAPSPSADYSLSDSDLYDKVMSGEAPADAAPSGEASAKPEAEEKTPPDAVADEQKPADADVEREDELDLDAIPEARKRLFKEDPNLRRAYYLQKRLEETGLSWQEMQEYRDNFQSIEDLRQASQAARSLYALSNDFLSGTDEGHDRLFDALAQINPDAANRLARRISGRLPTLDPETYQTDATAKLELAMRNLAVLWEKDDYRLDRLNEFKALAMEEIESGRVPSRQAPQAAQAMQDDGTAASAQQATISELSTIVDGLLGGYKGKAYTPEMKEEMKGKILVSTVRSLTNNPTFEFQANAILADRTKPLPERLSVLRTFVRSRAQRVLAMNAAKVTAPFEKALRAAGAERVAHGQKLASRREAPGGPAGTGSAPSRIDYETMSDMDIINALAGS